jgi:hypothetical protein
MKWGNDQKDNFIFSERFDDLTNEENETINTLLERSETLISEFSKPRGIDIDVHIYCIKGSITNAFCFKTNNHYYISIYSGLFKTLLDRSKRVADYILNDSELLLPYKQNYIIDLLLMSAYKSILMHEYMHIVLGHCDYVCQHLKFLYEVDKENDKKDSCITLEEKKAIEMLADECSCIIVGTQVIDKQNSISKMKEILLIFYLSEIMLFSAFESDNNSSIDHPVFAFRFNSIAIMLDDFLTRNISVDNPDDFIFDLDSVIDDLVSIIKACPDVLSINMLKYLIGDDFEKEYFELYNVAASLIEITNEFAAYKLDRLNPMNKDDLQNYDIQKQTLYNDFLKAYQNN